MDKKMKLVNYDELHEIYVDFYNHAVKEDNRYEQQIYEIAILALEDMPTIEAQPVKHGRWLDNGMVYTCSECNSSVPKNIFVIGCDFEGCPYCFARMDGDTNG